MDCCFWSCHGCYADQLDRSHCTEQMKFPGKVGFRTTWLFTVFLFSGKCGILSFNQKNLFLGRWGESETCFPFSNRKYNPDFSRLMSWYPSCVFRKYSGFVIFFPCIHAPQSSGYEEFLPSALLFAMYSSLRTKNTFSFTPFGMSETLVNLLWSCKMSICWSNDILTKSHTCYAISWFTSIFFYLKR